MKLFKLMTFCSVIACTLILTDCYAEEKSAEPAKVSPLSIDEFMGAALNGKIETVRKAIKDNLDIDITTGDGKTALMLASYNGHAEIVKLLIDAKAKVTAKDANNRSALMYACTGKDSTTVELLLKNGAEINAIDNGEHFSPLMWAAAEGRAEICKILLAKGADPSMKDVDGDTASTFAAKSGHTKLSATLEAAEKKTKEKKSEKK